MKWRLLSVALIAALIRLYNLSLPPLFFDESIHATILKTLFSGTYKYDPAYHGPMLYYLISAPVLIFGESEFSLRLSPAVAGILVAVIPFLYVRFIGFKASLFASVLVAVSAATVNYSRFCREDVFQMLFTALFAYFIFRYLESKKRFTELKFGKDSVYIFAAFLTLAFFATLKETFYPYAFIFLLYFVFDAKKFRVTDLAAASALFLLFYTALYTNFYSYNEPLHNISEFPAVRAVSYWMHQHEIARIGGPFYYYLELILLYDFPAFILSLFGLRVVIKKRGDFQSFVAFWFVSSLIFLSYMQEKVPWLVVHILFPMYLLAGIGFSSIRSKRVALAVAAVCLIFSAYGSVQANHINPINPAEPVLYLPTHYDVREFAEKTRNDTVYVFTEVGEYWPLAWYLRHHKAYFITSIVEGWNFGSGSYVVVNATNDYRLQKNELEFVENMVVRCWTFWTLPDFSRLPEFILFREPLADVACMNFSVYRAR